MPPGVLETRARGCIAAGSGKYKKMGNFAAWKAAV
jgi:hypothetical protein